MTQTNPLTSIVFGKDKNYFKKLVVSNGVFNANCDVVIPFSAQYVTFQIESGTFVEYSFNGNTLHGDSVTGKASASLTFENRRICKIWFRGTGTIRIEAWSE